MSWYKEKPKRVTEPDPNKVDFPDGLWQKCPSCSTSLFNKDMEENAFCCHSCGHHFYMPYMERIHWLFGGDNFEIAASGLSSKDPLEFVDKKSYQGRLDKLKKAGQNEDSFVIATGISEEGQKIAVGVNNYKFLGGSMGSVMGEKIVRLFEIALKEDLPVVIFSASGGARMQESVLSLMQMAKTSAISGKFKEKIKKPFVSVLCDPTTGGVSASYAFLGDFIFAEPKALICFAGPRVIEQTIRETLPEGFQRSEFLFEKGMIDGVFGRPELRKEIIKALSLF